MIATYCLAVNDPGALSGMFLDKNPNKLPTLRC